MKKTKSKLFKHDNHITDAIEFLRQNEPEGGYFLAFSGGKDSIVCYDLAVKSGVNFKAYYSCTRLDPPEIYKFIKTYYPIVKWLFPKKSFWKYLKEKGYPTKMNRWCCDKLKENSQNILLTHRIIGVRAEESAKRANREKIDIMKRSKKKGGNIITYKPIFNWLEWMVWDYIEENNLPYPSLYDEGFDRIGCVVCPFLCGLKKLEAHQKRWPKLYSIFEKVMIKMFEDKLKHREEYSHIQDGEEFLKLWYLGRKIQNKKGLLNESCTVSD